MREPLQLHLIQPRIVLERMLYQLGEIDLKEGRTTDALLEYRKAAKLDPRNPKTHFGLSKVYRKLGRVEEASQETKLFEELKEAKPAASTALPGEPH